jgi:hypothetical protein
MPPKNRTRRTPEQMIADLHAEIERIKTKAAEQKVKKDPALRHISGAVKAIDKAASATKDAATRTALNEARATLTACLALHGATPKTPGARRSQGPAPDAARVLAYIKSHPGVRSEAICQELGTDAASLRGVLHQLRDDGKVSVEGKARATRYSAKK